MPRLIDEALAIHDGALRKSRVDVRCEFEKKSLAMCDRAKLTQILVNLIANAEESLAQTAATERHLTLHTKNNENGNVEIHVIDDGCGIAPEVRDRLFTYGFTTKKTGHGFGLHASALAALEMGGTLRAHYDDADLGARFIVELPLSRGEAPTPFAA